MNEGITKITAFQTSDGLVFVSLTEAVAHQKALNFNDWFSDNGYQQFRYGEVTGTEVYKWLQDHADYLLNLLTGDSQCE